MENEKVEILSELLKNIYAFIDSLKQTIEDGVCLYNVNFEQIHLGEKNKRQKEVKEVSEDQNKHKQIIDLINKIRSCNKCELSLKRTNVVAGSGPIDTKVMIIGEAPGEQEDLQGLPFVGKAGQLLTKLLELSGIQREKIYITNCVKCRPPNNRIPYINEMIACSEYLKKQIYLIEPKLIISLGATSIQFLLNKKVSITKVRGTLINTQVFGKNILVFPTFHPSFLLRDNRNIPLAQQDFNKLSLYIKENNLL